MSRTTAAVEAYTTWTATRRHVAQAASLIHSAYGWWGISLCNVLVYDQTWLTKRGAGRPNVTITDLPPCQTCQRVAGEQP